MRHLSGQDPMSPQIMLRRHASSAAALLERKEASTTKNFHSVKKRPPPARPPLPARLRSIQPLAPGGGQPNNLGAASDRKQKISVQPIENQVYVTSSSRICFGRSVEGLVEQVAPKLKGCRPPAPPPPPLTAGSPIQTMRNVTVQDGIETQAMACWLEGSFVERFLLSSSSRSSCFELVGADFLTQLLLLHVYTLVLNLVVTLKPCFLHFRDILFMSRA